MAPVVVPTASLYDSWWNAIIGKFLTIVDNITEMTKVSLKRKIITDDKTAVN